MTNPDVLRSVGSGQRDRRAAVKVIETRRVAGNAAGIALTDIKTLWACSCSRADGHAVWLRSSTPEDDLGAVHVQQKSVGARGSPGPQRRARCEALRASCLYPSGSEK
jgi:hypothetical protein